MRNYPLNEKLTMNMAILQRITKKPLGLLTCTRQRGTMLNICNKKMHVDDAGAFALKSTLLIRSKRGLDI